MNRTQIRPGSGTIAVTPADLLRVAADYLDTHGWYQGALYDRRDNPLTPPACAIGALYIARTGQPVNALDTPDFADRDGRVRDSLRALVSHLADHDQMAAPAQFDDDAIAYEQPIGDWNDEDERTITDVTGALREAADGWDFLHPTGGAA